MLSKRSALKAVLAGALIILVWLVANPALAATKTDLHWYGHSAFKITTPSGKVLLLDPWLTNPANKNGKDDLAKLNRADLILISHGHFDHIGDAVEIAKKTNARLVSTYDLGRSIAQYDGYPKNLVTYDTQGNFGGRLNLYNGEVEITFVPAIHSSTVAPQEAQGDNFGEVHPAGNPGGFIVRVKNGPTIYHTGDTDLFSDMALISRFYKVNVMLACIGDHFTMGPERAAEAVSLVRPAIVVPMHYQTFPAIPGSPQAFAQALKKQRVQTQLRVMKVGESIQL